MDSVLSVYNNNFSGDGKELTKVSRTVRKNKLFIRTINWNLENLVKIYHGIIEIQRLVDPKRTALLKELYEE